MTGCINERTAQHNHLSSIPIIIFSATGCCSYLSTTACCNDFSTTICWNYSSTTTCWNYSSTTASHWSTIKYLFASTTKSRSKTATPSFETQRFSEAHATIPRSPKSTAYATIPRSSKSTAYATIAHAISTP